MEPQNQKPITSVLYLVSNRFFEEECIFNFWRVLSSFKEGPQAAANLFADIWNKTKERIDVSKVDVVDISKNIQASDFNITFRETSLGQQVFFVCMPEYQNHEGLEDACKAIAFALTQDRPRIFTMEYSKSFVGKSEYFTFGEWKFNYIQGKFAHLNYGRMERDTLEHFATIVDKKLIEDGAN